MNALTMLMAKTSTTAEGAGAAIIILYLAIIGIGLYINYVVAKKFEEIAFGKGYTQEIHSFAMCFWLGIIGYIYVLALPNLISMHQQEALLKSLKSIKNDTAEIEDKANNEQQNI